METHKLLELYKEALEHVLTCLGEDKSAAKWPDLPTDIPDSTDSEDISYKDFVKTRNLVRERLEKYARLVYQFL